MAKVIITEQYLEDIADAIRAKNGLQDTYYPFEMADAISAIDTSGVTINNQNKSVTPTESSQSVTADSGYTGLGTVTVGAISSSYVGSGVTQRTSTDLSASGATVTAPAGYYTAAASKAVSSGTEGTPTATKGTVSNHSVSVTPSVTNSAGYISGGTHTGTAVNVSASELVSGNKAISANGNNIDVTNYATVSVSVSGDAPTIDTLSVTPSETEQTFNSSSVDGYKPVTVGAISSTYVGSEIDRRVGSDVTQGTWTYSTNGTYGYATCNITVPAGYYDTAVTKGMTKIIANITDIPTKAVTTITPTESSQVAVNKFTWTTGDITVAAISSDYVGSGITQRDSTDLTVSGATVSVPAGYYSAAASKSVATGSATGPSSLSASSATITTGTNTITLTKTSVTTTPTVSAGYVSAATASTATVALTASVTVNPTPTASGATVTIPAGYYSAQTTKSVDTMTLPTSAAASATTGYTSKATISRSTSDQYINIAPGYNSAGGYYKISAVTNGSATAPSTISGTSATVSTGTNTLTLTKTVSVTPTVSAGYVSSGTAGNSSVSLTASVTTKAAATYHPSTTAQSIAASTYLTGAQTIAAVTTTNLSASNIVSGVTIKVGDSSDDDCVASVTGNVVLQNYYTGSSAPASGTGSNGDLYLQT